MKQRQAHHDDVLLGDGEAEGPIGDVADQAMGADDALREASGARGVHEEGEMFRIHAVVRTASAALSNGGGTAEQVFPPNGFRSRLI